MNLSFVASETEARIAVIEKDNIELGRLGKTLKTIPQYISMSQLSDEVIAQAKADIEGQLKLLKVNQNKFGIKLFLEKLKDLFLTIQLLDQEQCLLDQNFIKDENQNVAEYIKSYGNVMVSDFKRVALG